MSLVIYGFDLLSLKGAYLISSIFLTAWLYAYICHLYRSQASGRVDYEKYGELALKDSLDDALIESRDVTKNNRIIKRS